MFRYFLQREIVAGENNLRSPNYLLYKMKANSFRVIPLSKLSYLIKDGTANLLCSLYQCHPFIILERKQHEKI